jgi:hypothetical protein
MKHERNLEILLVLITLALACILSETTGMKLIVLNLFYLPVVMAGFFLGKYRSGVLALLSVIAATLVISTDIGSFLGVATPLTIALAITTWGATLGLTAILVGTLCDDRDSKTLEAHEAHVGVVEVLARYLQSANPELRDRALRVANLAEAVARKLRLSARQIDDIRVAALLIDIENIEITARVIRKAMDNLESEATVQQRTFHGTELVQSLGATLKGAFPLLLTQSGIPDDASAGELPFGAQIIRTVRNYVQLMDDPWKTGRHTPDSAIDELRCDVEMEPHPAVLHALEEVVQSEAAAGSQESSDRVSEELAAAGAGI